MLHEVILYLDKPYLDYDSNIFLSSLPEETLWFRVSDTREYTGSIILRIAELKKFGYKIIYRKFY